MKPQVVAWELGKRLDRRRDHFVRFRHDRHLVRPPYSGKKRPETFAFRHAGDHGQWSSVHHRRSDCLSGPPVHRVCRRRRIHDADGRVRNRSEIPASDQDCGDQEQYARPDQMGANGFPGKPRVWLRSESDRFLRIRAKHAAAPAFGSRIPRHADAILDRGAGASRGPCLSKRWSIRTSRRCRPK